MKQLDSLQVDHCGRDPRHVTLNRADIMDLYDASIDYLVISSRSRDYDLAQGGWVERLYGSGIDVALLESTCAMDFRSHLLCWISTAAPQASG